MLFTQLDVFDGAGLYEHLHTLDLRTQIGRHCHGTHNVLAQLAHNLQTWQIFSKNTIVNVMETQRAF